MHRLDAPRCKWPKVRWLAVLWQCCHRTCFWQRMPIWERGYRGNLFLNLYTPIEQADDCGVADQLLLRL